MEDTLKQVSQHLARGQIDTGEALCRAFTRKHPDQASGWLLLGRICQARGDIAEMLVHAEKAVRAAPHSFVTRLQEAEASLLCGRPVAASKINALEKAARDNADVLQQVARFYIDLERHADAMRCYQRARTLIGDDPELLYNCAATATALGDLAGAEALYDAVIARNPDDYAAHYNRATLRTQTAESNHIAEMEALRQGGLKPGGDPVQLGYALAKEYEDIAEYDAAFAALKQAADSRRDRLRYDVAGDVATMAEIKAVMTGDFFADCPAVEQAPGPLFILGQPRSGSTLVDRILSSHSGIESLGEITNFVSAFMAVAGTARNKADLVRKTATIDCRDIGKRYLETTRHRCRGNGLFIDKTPANFLYIGLIVKALPNARIIHLRRDPMDNCYAMYKTLFQMGYPYSYSLQDLGTYYSAYHDLMAHWRKELPGRILDVDYELLVAEQEAQSRRLIAHCGLDWEEACFDFHRNDSATATASAAQVRRPIYRSSVAKWRHHEANLAPLRSLLSDAGIHDHHA